MVSAPAVVSVNLCRLRPCPKAGNSNPSVTLTLIAAPKIAASSYIHSFSHPLRPAGIICSMRGTVRGKLLDSVLTIWHLFGVKPKLYGVSVSLYRMPYTELRDEADVARFPPMRERMSRVSLPLARSGRFDKASA